MLDRIDDALVEGRIEATLPDGGFRVLGGRGAGPTVVVHLKSWRSLVRLAASGSVGWYKAWALGEWTSPDPVPLFDLFMRNAGHLATPPAPRGRGARSTGSPIACAPTTGRERGATSPIITISGTTSTPPGSTPA